MFVPQAIGGFTACALLDTPSLIIFGMGAIGFGIPLIWVNMAFSAIKTKTKYKPFDNETTKYKPLDNETTTRELCLLGGMYVATFGVCMFQ